MRISLNILVWLTGNVAVAFLHYKSIGPLFSSSDNFLLEPQSYDEAEEDGRVISSVISVSISSNPPTLYELEKITFTLSHVKVSCVSGDYYDGAAFKEVSLFRGVSLIVCEFLSLKILMQN